MLLFGYYLTRQYLKIFLLSLLFFLVIMVVSRLEEISRFATLGAPLSSIGYFTLCQLPHIIPLVFPISSLIASMVLFQHLSLTRELIALRAGGISLRRMVTPLLMLVAFLCLLNFYLISEVATTSHLRTRTMLYDYTKKNPLLLLKKAKMLPLKKTYLRMDAGGTRESANHLLLALPPHTQERLTLFLAKKIYLEEETLKGREVSLLSPFSGNNPLYREEGAELPAHAGVLIENQEESVIAVPELTELLPLKGWRASNDRLTLRLLRARIHSLCAGEEKRVPSQIARCYSEILRRISLAFAPLTMTIMGIAYGTEIARVRTSRKIGVVILLTLLMLVSFLVGKELDFLLPLSTTFFLLPHGILLYFSCRRLMHIRKGVAG